MGRIGRHPLEAGMKKAVFAMSIVAALFIGSCSTSTAPTVPIVAHFAFKTGEPANDSLYPIFPNPFNRVAGDTALTIQFSLQDTGSAQVVVQNALGDQVEIFSDSSLPSGYYTGSWNPLASDGTHLLSGLYFITPRNGNFIYSRLVNIQENQ